MTLRYVGIGGDNGNSGLTWALRKLTLVGVEDSPVVAGDTIYVGPGTYREQLALDVSGSSGNPITYIADVSGEHTDGVGGIVRITGSDDDSDPENDRIWCIVNYTRSQRTFRGFYFDEIEAHASVNGGYIHCGSAGGSYNNIIIEDCVFGSTTDILGARRYACIRLDNRGTVSNITIRNCIALPGNHKFVVCDQDDTDTNFSGSVIENCIIHGTTWIGVHLDHTYGWTIRHCTFREQQTAIEVSNVTSPNQNYVYDCHFYNCSEGMVETSAANTITEDYNTFCAVHTTIKEGANSETSWLFDLPMMLYGGIKFPHQPYNMTDWFNEVFLSSTSSFTEDFYGLFRPSKSTRGATQLRSILRDTSVYRSAPSSLKLADAAKHVLLIPVIGGSNYRITVYVNREANYAGTNPQLVIRSPGQSAITATDDGNSGSFNKLTVSYTTVSTDRFLQIEFRSNNTATSGSYKAYFDDLTIRGTGTKIPTLKWITNEILLYSFELEGIVDPWIGSTITVPGAGPASLTAPFPAFLRQY